MQNEERSRQYDGALLQMEQVSFCYPSSAEPALRDISFSVFPSEFVVLCGQSGCGKSTLLRHMKKNQIPFGSGSGRILFQGNNIEEMEDRESARLIGYVGQNPENQIVTDRVWHELAFGLESLGTAREEIRKRTAEMAEYFGMGSWFRKPVAALSGGQKQILNLAAVMVMKPELLILDEPTSQLDPIGAQRFIQTLLRLNQDFGIAIILSEQRLEEVLPIADKILLMHQGELLGTGGPEECAGLLQQAEEKLGEELPVAGGMPVALRTYLKADKSKCQKQKGNVPLTVREGKHWLRTELRCCRKNGLSERDSRSQGKESLAQKENSGKKKKTGQALEPVLQAKNISFRYEKGQRLLEEFGLTVEKGSIYAILGGNGSGKTTVLKVLSGICRPAAGKVKAQGRVVYLSQNPQSIFTEITVQEELAEVFEDYGRKDKKEKAAIRLEEIRNRVNEMLEFMELTPQREQNPLDLSGGQQQRLALGKVLLLEPDILLLDEPTKGLDAAFKKKLSQLLRELKQKGMTILMVSHDMEFCAENATHCGLLFDGQIISSNTAREFFAENSFYTTAVSRMTSGVLEGCILWEDLLDKMQEFDQEVSIGRYSWNGKGNCLEERNGIHGEEKNKSKPEEF